MPDNLDEIVDAQWFPLSALTSAKLFAAQAEAGFKEGLQVALADLHARYLDG